MWDLIVSVPDHCLSFYFVSIVQDFNPIIYYCSQLSSITVPFSEFMLSV